MSNKLDCVNVHRPNCIYYESWQCPDKCEGYKKVINDAIKEIEVIKEERTISKKRKE